MSNKEKIIQVTVLPEYKDGNRGYYGPSILCLTNKGRLFRRTLGFDWTPEPMTLPRQMEG